MKQFVSIILFVLALSACTASKPMYYFGDYSETLYEHEQNKSEETLLKHKAELENIISESKSIAIPIPPGIYAELGYIYLKMNDSTSAINFFKQEKMLFPESTVLMDRLIQKSKAKEESKIISEEHKQTDKQLAIDSQDPIDDQMETVDE